MEYLINKLKSFGFIDGNNVVEGYILMNDEKANKSYVMIKQDNKCWKTEWVANSAIAVKTPEKSLSDVINGV
jgi:hypothetical protein